MRARLEDSQSSNPGSIPGSATSITSRYLALSPTTTYTCFTRSDKAGAWPQNRCIASWGTVAVSREHNLGQALPRCVKHYSCLSSRRTPSADTVLLRMCTSHDDYSSIETRSVKNSGSMDPYTDILCPTCGKKLAKGIAPRYEPQHLRIWCKICCASREIVRKPPPTPTKRAAESINENVVPSDSVAMDGKQELSARFTPALNTKTSRWILTAGCFTASSVTHQAT